MQGYRRALADLAGMMGADHRSTDQIATGALRRIVSSVTILPGSAAGQIHITIHGYLRELLDCPPQDRRVWGAVVAREGVACSPQLDPIFLLQRVA